MLLTNELCLKFSCKLLKRNVIYIRIILVFKERKQDMRKIIAILMVLLMCTALITGCGNEVVYEGETELTGETTAKDGGNKEMNYEAKPTDALLDINDIKTVENPVVDDEYAVREPEKGETVAIIHTSMGDIKMRFLDEVAPLATNSFIALAENGRYDNTIFHRVINNFMIQGGDYTNFNGTGGASAYGTEFNNEVAENVSNVRGAVAMANAGPDTNGSQFYINQVDNNYLDGGYTVFGYVYEGMDVVDSIANVQTGYSDKSVEDVIIEYIEVEKF